MSKKTVAIGRGSLAEALSAATGVALAEKPQEPAITSNWSDSEFRERLTRETGINGFRELVRQELAMFPDVRDEVIVLAARFDAHPGYAKLVATLRDIKTEMDKPEFDFGDPARLRRWINWMFHRAVPQS